MFFNRLMSVLFNTPEAYKPKLLTTPNPKSSYCQRPWLASAKPMACSRLFKASNSGIWVKRSLAPTTATQRSPFLSVHGSIKTGIPGNNSHPDAVMRSEPKQNLP